jgi:hypothetical protein
MSKSMTKINDDNLTLIARDAMGNLELQTLILGFIQDYTEREQRLVLSSPSTQDPQVPVSLANPTSYVQTSRLQKRGASQIFRVDDGTGDCQDGERPIPRQAKKFSGWSPKLIHEAFHFCEPKLFSLVIGNQAGKYLYRQMFERAFGLKTSDGDSDTCKLTTKREVFTALHELYLGNGRPLRKLHYMDGGKVDWFHPASGVYFLSVENSNPILSVADYFVNDRMACRKVKIDPECTGAQTPDEFLQLRIGLIFSATLASIMPKRGSKKPAPMIADMFPRIVRTLRRNMSDDLDVTWRADDDGTDEPSPKRKACWVLRGDDWERDDRHPLPATLERGENGERGDGGSEPAISPGGTPSVTDGAKTRRLTPLGAVQPGSPLGPPHANEVCIPESTLLASPCPGSSTDAIRALESRATAATMDFTEAVAAFLEDQSQIEGAVAFMERDSSED